jgi:hypothetical protein
VNAQYQHEPKVIIDDYYREASRAEQIRMARSDKPGRIASLAIRISTSITALVAAGGSHIHPEPAAAHELVAYDKPVEEPAATAVVA